MGVAVVGAVSAVSVACADSDAGEGEGEGEGETATCTEPTPVPCEDDVIVDLNMNLNVAAPGEISSVDVGDGVFEVDVDARAGGSNGPDGWVYGAFGDDGMLKVNITDLDSLGSLDWDIGFRRFIIRLNSGYGGPSCVTAARTAADTFFSAVDAVPEGLRFNAEEFMSDPESCTVIADGSGLGTPSVVLQNWWEYPGCVATTGNVYILALKDGRHVKLEITQYYEGPDAQDQCNFNFTAAGEPARIRLRYAFLD
jgi:hypothetical protein